MATTRRKKGRSEFGYTRQLPSGRWQASYVDKAGVRRNAPRTFANTEEDRNEMRLWLAAKQLAFYSGEGTQAEADRLDARRTAKQLTLGTYADQWIENRIVNERFLKARTKAEYRRLLESPNALGPLRDYRLQGITKRVVSDWWKETSSIVNPRTGKKQLTQASRAFAFLKAVLETAVAEDYIAENPCVVRGAMDVSSGLRKKRNLIRPDELRVALENLDEFYRLFVLVSALGGLRFGELIALKREDVDVSGNLPVLRVRAGSVYLSGQGYVDDTTKTDEDRVVPLVPQLLEPLRQHLNRYVQPEQTARVFPNQSGGVLAYSTMARHWYRAREIAGRTDVPFHDLRHYAGTTYAQIPGVTEKEIMERLGHKTKAASWIYQHTTGREVEQAESLGTLQPVSSLF